MDDQWSLTRRQRPTCIGMCIISRKFKSDELNMDSDMTSVHMSAVIFYGSFNSRNDLLFRPIIWSLVLTLHGSAKGSHIKGLKTYRVKMKII
jgi:hypothetical protein